MITSSILKHHKQRQEGRSRSSTKSSFTMHNANTRPHLLVHMFKSASQCSEPLTCGTLLSHAYTRIKELKSAELSWLSLLHLGLDSVWYYLQEWRLGIHESGNKVSFISRALQLRHPEFKSHLWSSVSGMHWVWSHLLLRRPALKFRV